MRFFCCQLLRWLPRGNSTSSEQFRSADRSIKRRELRERYERLRRTFRYIPEQRLDNVISAVKPLLQLESRKASIPTPKFRRVDNIPQTAFPFPWIYEQYVYASCDPRKEAITVARGVPYPDFYVEAELISSTSHEWVHHRQLYEYADGDPEKFLEDNRDDPPFLSMKPKV